MADIDDPAHQAEHQAHDDEPSADVHQFPCVPDPEAMREHLTTLFGYAIKGKIELAWTTLAPGTKERVKLNNAQLFSVDDDSIESLIAYACELGAQPNVNTYIGVALRSEDANMMGRHGAKDCIAIPALKADCDGPGDLTRALTICEEIGMRPNLVVKTGEVPHLRGALYWVLEEPVGPEEFARVERIERAMVKLFGSDPAVVDCPRVMRLAGGVAWPVKQGRVLEPTAIYRSPFGDRAAPYTLEENEHCVAKRVTHTPASNPVASETGASPGGFLDLNDATPGFNAEALLAEARRAGHWHDAALKLCAHYWNKHTPDDVIVDLLAPMLRQDGYSLSETRTDLAVMIMGAARKWTRPERKPEPEPEPRKPGADDAPAADASVLGYIPLDQCGARGDIEWLYDKLMPKRGLGVLYGASGNHKSFHAIDIGGRASIGIEWCGFKIAQPVAVAYVAAEDADGIEQRMGVWRDTRGADYPEQLAQAQFGLVPEVINLLDPNEVRRLARHLLALPRTPGLIIIDTLSRSFGGNKENDSSDMSRFVNACLELSRWCDAFVLVIHHEGKDGAKGERGSNVLACNEHTRMHVTREDRKSPISTITVEKVKNGPDSMSVMLEMRLMVTVNPFTGEEVKSLLPVWDGEVRNADDAGSTASSGPRKHRRGKSKNQLIIETILRDAGPLSLSDLYDASGINSRGSVWYALTALVDRKSVVKHGELYAVSGADGGDEDAE